MKWNDKLLGKLDERLLSSPIGIAQINFFISSMWGRLSDGTHHLKGKEKRAKINEIKKQREVVWALAKNSLESDYGEKATAERLKNILFILEVMNG